MVSYHIFVELSTMEVIEKKLDNNGQAWYSITVLIQIVQSVQ